MAKVTNSISLSGSGGSSIIVVANYSALPDPTTVSGEFYWVSNSQGTKWLPGSLGGTYYNSGLYYSNGTTWEFMNVPYQATQLEVDTGTNTDKFVTPSTLSNSTWAFTTEKTLATLLTGLSAASGTFTSSDTLLTAFGKIKYLIDNIATTYQAILTYVPIKSIIADYTTSSGVTGTTSETLISSYKINANTLSALDFMNMTLRLLKTGTTAGYLITIRIGTTSTFSTSLTQIAQYGNTLSTGADVNFQRYFKIEGGSLKGSNFTFNILGNQGVSVNSAESSTSFNVSVDNWIFISVKPQSNNADVITQSIFKITN